MKSNAQGITTGLPFNNFLSGYTTYSSIYYHFGGNDFAGMFFWTTGSTLSIPETIVLSGNTTPISCRSRINGMYYNNVRWRRLWPLDSGNLQTLRVNDAGYVSMSLTGWLFTDCIGTGINANEIYGQITHTWQGINYYIIAGVNYNFSTNSMSSTSFSWSFKILTGIADWFLYDNYGGIWEIWSVTTPSRTVGISVGTFPLAVCSNIAVTQQSGSNVTLTCTGSNASQYILNLFSNPAGQLIGQSIIGITNTSYSWNTNLPATGNYIVTCTVNVGSSTCPQLAINYNGGNISSSWGTQTGTSYTWTRLISPISSINHAKLSTIYTSDNFSIQWLSGSTLATITKGYLSINGTGAGTTGYINNGDTLNIQLISSDEYATTISSDFSAAGLTGRFSVTTIDPDSEVCMFTKTQKLTIAELLSTLKADYSNNGKRNTLLYTLRSMISDIQAFDYSCNLQYLNDLVENEIGDTTPEKNHIAPNCKKYTILYDEDKAAYTASNFKSKQYFISQEALIRFIDGKNPGDCHINTYDAVDENYDNTDDTKYTAPNGKVYEITEGTGLYYSPTMTKKRQFDTRDALINYLDLNNPAIEIRDHEVNADIEPIIYAAPNNKEYKIYSTDKGYMSYNLIKVKYFTSLDEIKAYIDRNNRK